MNSRQVKLWIRDKLIHESIGFTDFTIQYSACGYDKAIRRYPNQLKHGGLTDFGLAIVKTVVQLNFLIPHKMLWFVMIVAQTLLEIIYTFIIRLKHLELILARIFGWYGRPKTFSKP